MTVLITGAARGLGAALAGKAMANGQSVCAVDVRWDTPPSWTHHAADLANLDALPNLIEALKENGPFRTVIHNAAISATGRFEEIPASAHQRLIDLNATAPMLMTNSLLQNGLIEDGATFVFIASLSVQVGYPGATSYAASKAALANYAKSLRKALQPRGIHVLTVFPGPMKTDQARTHAPKGADEAKRMAPEEAATRIWNAIEKRQATLVPGATNRAFAAIGTLAPALLTKTMKKIIYDKLDGPVY